jgi:DNA-binding SARP family transcriptional activator
MEPQLTIELFGGLRVRQAERVIAEFPPQQLATLLALLALAPGRHHVREELIAQLWPEADVEEGRQRLRQLLYTLRHQLEQPPFPRDSVLRTTRAYVGLNSDTVTTDVIAFEAALKAAWETADPHDRAQLLHHALELYRADLRTSRVRRRYGSRCV